MYPPARIFDKLKHASRIIIEFIGKLNGTCSQGRVSLVQLWVIVDVFQFRNMIFILKKRSEVYLVQIVWYLETPLVVAAQKPTCLSPNFLFIHVSTMHLTSTFQVIEISYSCSLAYHLHKRHG